jgi:uncharacterized membrane protein YeiH
MLEVNFAISALAAATLVVVVRILAIRNNWELPRAKN